MKAKTRKMINDHWKIFSAAIIACVIAVIGAFSVLIWFVGTSDIGLQGTATFDQWSVAWVVEFIIMLILWELLFVGLPAALFFGVGGYLWWQRLANKQRQEFRMMGREDKSHRARNAGGSGFFMNIAYVIYIYIEGNFYTPFGNLPYSYWLYAYLWTIFWVCVIFGIPAAIAGAVYCLKCDKKPARKKKPK